MKARPTTQDEMACHTPDPLPVRGLVLGEPFDIARRCQRVTVTLQELPLVPVSGVLEITNYEQEQRSTLACKT